MTTRPLAAIILAAGQGTRMKSELHKVLHPIAGKPMLHHLIDTVEAMGAEKIVVVVGARREQVEDSLAGRDVEIVVQAEQLGTGHAAAQAKDALAGFAGDILVMFGDTPLVGQATLAAMIDRLNGGIAPRAVVLGFRPPDPGRYGRIVAQADGTVEKMVEYKDASADERAVDLCNSGILAARSGELFALLANIENDNAAEEYYLPDIVMLPGQQSAVVEVTDLVEVAGVNSRGDLAMLERQWQDRRRAEALAEGVTMMAPETVWFAADTDIAADVTIEPNVFFGPGVSIGPGSVIHGHSHIEGAQIGAGVHVGPFARLRPGAVLQDGSKIGNFVEMKKSTLGAGAKASHLTYLGDTDVGANANVGAGTITCNYDGFLKYRTEIGAGAFIGSNSALVAPVRIGDGAMVAAGSTVSSDVADDALALVRPEQIEKPGWAKRFRDAMTRKKHERNAS